VEAYKSNCLLRDLTQVYTEGQPKELGAQLLGCISFWGNTVVVLVILPILLPIFLVVMLFVFIATIVGFVVTAVRSRFGTGISHSASVPTPSHAVNGASHAASAAAPALSSTTSQEVSRALLRVG
jgi:hypothetical protein